MKILEVNHNDTYFNKVELKITAIVIINKIVDAINFAIKQVIKDFQFTFKNDSINDKILCFSNSLNQFNALKPLKSRIENLVFSGLSRESENRIPMGVGCVISFLMTPMFIWEIIMYRDNRNKLIYFIESYFFIRGIYVWWVIYLKFHKPKVIIMSNDHLVWHRVLRMAGQKNSIPVVYIQHASVTEKFPRLEYDLSLLEGRDALSKYEKKGISGKVELVGMIKYDLYHGYINKTNSVNTIGFCTNLLDEEEKIYNTVTTLYNNIDNKRLIIRPHPRDQRHGLYDRLKEELGIELSNSKSENAFEFLQKIDVNVASECSIHLEAVLLNVYPIYFKLKYELSDHYGFIKNGLIDDVFEGVIELSKRIKQLDRNRPFIRYKAKHYIDTVGTKDDGKSVEKSIHLLKKYSMI
jgi:hypothetical protein